SRRDRFGRARTSPEGELGRASRPYRARLRPRVSIRKRIETNTLACDPVGHDGTRLSRVTVASPALGAGAPVAARLPVRPEAAQRRARRRMPNPARPNVSSAAVEGSGAWTTESDIPPRLSFSPLSRIENPTKPDVLSVNTEFSAWANASPGDA